MFAPYLRLDNMGRLKKKKALKDETIVWQMVKYLTLNKCSLHSTNIGVLMTAVDIFPRFRTKTHCS